MCGIIVLRNVNICNPNINASNNDSKETRKTIIIINDKIFSIISSNINDHIEEFIETFNANVVEIIDCNNIIAIPGLVDVHVHVTGGGGEAGPSSRTPAANINELIECGVTTVCGILGTDGVSRSLIDLLVKCRGLDEEGITTYMWTGNYHVPVLTITGSITKDLTIIDKIIGVGELAISDHRGSQPSINELTRVAADTNVAGILTKKAGKVHLHVGKHHQGIGLLFDIINQSAIPIDVLYPTHVNIRGEILQQQCLKWLKLGGYCDITATLKSRSATDCLQYFCNDKDVPLDHITLSSDAYGSSPKYDNDGHLIGYGYHTAKGLLINIKRLVKEYNWPLAKAITICTSNPADYLQMHYKGRIKVGNDADIVLIDSDTFLPVHVISKGKLLMKNKQTNCGFFKNN